MHILGRKEKELRNTTISLVKVLWRNHLVEEATWKREDQMRSQYPRLFHNTGTKVPSKAVNKTPYELWTGKKPSIRHLHVWGCPAEARPYRPNERKLDSRTVSCYFVGYPERSKGYKFYDPSSRSFFETGNAKFIEDSGSTQVKEIIFEEYVKGA